ncbi:putative low-complexity protein [Streptomyces sp. SFB5A]|uniref:Putative low-complexity protein n=2 Tax=Streptomyces nymphaeiformis TaxID=2663842 RepID=A0A7W7UBD2_9ACTN|nr:putative low-complexity protein [Streptomyces nymphaeiformis]
MLRNKVFTALAAAALTLLALPAASASAKTPADTTGMAIASVEYKGTVTTLAALEKKIGETHCHDGKGKGKLTCFATEREADLDLLAKGGLPAEAAKAAARKWGVAVPKQTRVAAAAATGTCHPWVTVRYYDGNYGTGSSVNLYCDYPDLSQVGWDNRANSLTCMVCSPIQHPDVKGMASFQNYNYMFNQQLTQTSATVQAASANTISSNRLYFY